MPALSPYELRHLLGHLKSSSRHDDAHCLLGLSSVAGTNYWFAEKEAIGDQQGYGEDLRDALGMAEQSLRDVNRTDRLETIGLIMRYGASIATMNGFAANLSSGVLRELIRRNIWNSGAALDYASRTPNPDRRVASLCAVFPFLPGPQQEECYFRGSDALQALETIAGTPATLIVLQQEAVSKLAQAYAQGGRSDLVVRLCNECQSQGNLLATAARSLAAFVSVDLPAAQRCAESLYDSTVDWCDRSHLLGFLAPVRRSAYLSDIVDALQGGGLNPHQAVEVLKNMRQYLGREEFKRSVDVVYRVCSHYSEVLSNRFVSPLAALFGMLDDRQQDQALKRILPIISEAAWADYEIKGVLERLCQAAIGQRSAIIDAVRHIRNDYMRAVQTTVILDIQSESERDKAVDSVLGVVSLLRQRADGFSADELLYVLSQSSCHLSQSKRTQLLQMALDLPDRRNRLRMLAEILPYTSGAKIDEIIKTEIASLGQLDDNRVAEKFCSAAVVAASDRLVTAMPRALQASRLSGWFLVGLKPLVEQLEDNDSKAELLTWVVGQLRSTAEGIRYSCILAIAPHLGAAQAATAFEIAKTLGTCAFRLECCSVVVRASGTSGLEKDLSDLIDSELAASDLEARERCGALIKVLNAGLRIRLDFLTRKARDLLSQVNYVSHRAELLAMIGDWGSRDAERMKEELIETAFRNINDAVGRDVTKALAPTLSRTAVHKVLEYLEHASDGNLRREALPEVLARLAALGNPREALEVTYRQTGGLKEQCLVAVAPHLNRTLLAEMLPAYSQIENVYHRDNALRALCTRAAELAFPSDISSYAFSIRDPAARTAALCALVCGGARGQAGTMLAAALRSFGDVNEHMRHQLIPGLTEALLAESENEGLREGFLKIVKVLVTESREEFVPHGYALAALAARIGGKGAAERTFNAIREVVGWWP